MSVKSDDAKVAVKTKDTAGAAGSEAKPRGVLRWLTGWLMGPAVVVGGLFAAGVFVGVHHFDSWVARAVMWTAGLF